MKSVFESLLIAFSMYSAIPVPIIEWNEKNMRKAMYFFPLISVACGLGLKLIWLTGKFFGLNNLFVAVMSVAMNVLITGGIHIDGFCDTSDALYSRRPMERKLEILKDSHCGTFSVLALCVVLMLSCGAYSQLYEDGQSILLISCIFAVSRCLSGISVMRFPITPTSSLAKTFNKTASKNTALILSAELIIVFAVMTFLNPKIAVCIIISAFLVFFGYRRMAVKEFGGITGDLAGFFLVVCETVCLLLTAILGGVLK